MVKEVLEFNEKRGLLENCNIQLELKMLLEEVLELSTNDKPYIKNRVDSILKSIKIDNISQRALLDACIDVIYVAIGTMSKIIKTSNKDYSLEDIEKVIKAGMKVVCEANAKKSNNKNSDGKIIKDSSFVEPVIPMCLGEIND